MINSRDSYNKYNPSSKKTIEVPYDIGTIIELKENPNVLARICQYKITIDRIIIGLNNSSNNKYNDNQHNKMPQKFIAVDFTNTIDSEITIDELTEKWRKTDKIIIGKLNPSKERPFTRKLKKKTK